MRLGGKKIVDGKAKDIINEMKEDKHSKNKKKFLNEAKSIAKKHSK
ncbi:hypothetical protein [Bacillus alveayuensis]|uniref:Uncharacterized protein n=1 Tax=Aeribacillus alveayuensis TaxID=279215 RepID=A0ABT9VSW8_9BACI|nr:hypothetical protein [Bacillus alveayuensis]MDQ0164086.1 hypothetical protein [Bacillus alveayuensis]